MKRLLIITLVALSLTGCFRQVRQSYMYEDYAKSGISENEVKQALLECGFPSPFGEMVPMDRNWIVLSDRCMEKNGFVDANYLKLTHGKTYCEKHPEISACHLPLDQIPDRDVVKRLNSPFCKAYPNAEVCQAASFNAAVSLSDVEAARIRLFGQNGVGVILYKNSKCEGRSESIRVSGDAASAFTSFVGAASNESLGMPETETTKNLSKRDGILSKAYFREYRIDPGKPVTIAIRFQDVGKYCEPIVRTFTPEPRTDYEGRIDIDNAGFCRFSLNLVSSDGSLSTTALYWYDPKETCK